jgi:DNA-binding MarR family transcriptional regulator
MAISSGTASKDSLSHDADDATSPASLVPSTHRVPAHLARRFHQICLGVLAEVTEPSGISPLQYAMLAALEEIPGLDQRRLALRVGCDAVTAGQLIDGLEARGYVDRRVDVADRRSRVLRLTASGRRLRRKLRPVIAAAHQRILSPLSAKESALLVDFLTRVIESNESYARPGNGRRRPRAARPDATAKRSSDA